MLYEFEINEKDSLISTLSASREKATEMLKTRDYYAANLYEAWDDLKTVLNQMLQSAQVTPGLVEQLVLNDYFECYKTPSQEVDLKTFISFVRKLDVSEQLPEQAVLKTLEAFSPGERHSIFSICARLIDAFWYSDACPFVTYLVAAGKTLNVPWVIATDCLMSLRLYSEDDVADRMETLKALPKTCARAQTSLGVLYLKTAEKFITDVNRETHGDHLAKAFEIFEAVDIQDPLAVLYKAYMQTGFLGMTHIGVDFHNSTLGVTEEDYYIEIAPALLHIDREAHNGHPLAMTWMFELEVRRLWEFTWLGAYDTYLAAFNYLLESVVLLKHTYQYPLALNAMVRFFGQADHVAGNKPNLETYLRDYLVPALEQEQPEAMTTLALLIKDCALYVEDVLEYEVLFPAYVRQALNETRAAKRALGDDVLTETVHTLLQKQFDPLGHLLSLEYAFHKGAVAAEKVLKLLNDKRYLMQPLGWQLRADVLNINNLGTPYQQLVSAINGMWSTDIDRMQVVLSSLQPKKEMMPPDLYYKILLQVFIIQVHANPLSLKHSGHPLLAESFLPYRAEQNIEVLMLMPEKRVETLAHWELDASARRKQLCLFIDERETLFFVDVAHNLKALLWNVEFNPEFYRYMGYHILANATQPMHLTGVTQRTLTLLKQVLGQAFIEMVLQGASADRTALCNTVSLALSEHVTSQVNPSKSNYEAHLTRQLTLFSENRAEAEQKQSIEKYQKMASAYVAAFERFVQSSNTFQLMKTWLYDYLSITLPMDYGRLYTLQSELGDLIEVYSAYLEAGQISSSDLTATSDETAVHKRSFSAMRTGLV